MKKNKTVRRSGTPRGKVRSGGRGWVYPTAGIVLAVAAALVAVVLMRDGRSPEGSEPAGGPDASSTVNPVSDSSAALPEDPQPAGPPLESMELAKAVMVTVELDFGPRIPTIAEALAEVERQYRPDDGRGRTFAILDAYGGPTPDGKLHMSMHVSSEKPGFGSLVFKRTGRVLWRTRIVGGSQPAPAKNLTVFLDNGAGTPRLIDGSADPKSILDARVKDLNVAVREFWPDGAEREATFIFSACGCPVKVMVRRTGERTARTSDTPVIFPDDPAAVQTIGRLMGW